MQALLPTYLESSLSAFTRNQDQLREQMARALSGDAMGVIGDQARRNMDMFSEAMRMWMPFSPGGNSGPREAGGENNAKTEANEREIDSLRRQLSEMQKTLDTIAGRK
jgi:polyhydroxyalkanoate synthesis regulator protein